MKTAFAPRGWWAATWCGRDVGGGGPSRGREVDGAGVEPESREAVADVGELGPLGVEGAGDEHLVAAGGIAARRRRAPGRAARAGRGGGSAAGSRGPEESMAGCAGSRGRGRPRCRPRLRPRGGPGPRPGPGPRSASHAGARPAGRRHVGEAGAGMPTRPPHLRPPREPVLVGRGPVSAGFPTRGRHGLPGTRAVAGAWDGFAGAHASRPRTGGLRSPRSCPAVLRRPLSGSGAAGAARSSSSAKLPSHPEKPLLERAVGGQLAGRDDPADPAVDHDRDVVGDGRRDPDVLFDEEDGDVALGREGREQLLELGDDEGGEALGRLVEHQQPRVLEEGARDGEHLLLAARELPAAVAPPLGEPREHVVHPLHRPRAAAAPREAQVLVHGEVRPEPASLGGVGDAAGGHLVGGRAR